MKKIFVLFALLLTFYTTKAEFQPPYFTTGQEVFVTAPSGLNLREFPSKESFTLTTIPHGEMVCIKDVPVEETLVIEEIEYVRGYWTKVSYQGFEGYVFDGFLSPLSLPDTYQSNLENGKSIFNLLDKWVAKQFGSISNADSIFTENGSTIKVKLSDKEQFTKQYAGNTFTAKINLDDIRIMDAYMLIKAFYKQVDNNINLDEHALFIKDDAGQVSRIKITSDQFITIKKLKNGSILITIQESFSCC